MMRGAREHGTRCRKPVGICIIKVTVDTLRSKKRLSNDLQGVTSMCKTLYPRIFAGLLLIVISTACGIPFPQSAQPETETPVPPPSPSETETVLPTTRPTETIVSVPTEVILPDAGTPKFAPFCEPSSANVFTPTPLQCQMPIAEQSSTFCSSKVPYNLILINAGSTYEISNEEITCSDAGMKGGKQILTCTGPMASYFELRVCDPACAIPTFQAETTHCPQDYQFDEFLQCCEQRPQPIDQNCVVLKLQTKSCVVDCSVYYDEATCGQNANACKWDTEKNVCQPRR